MDLKIKLSEGAVIPTRATGSSAGLDLYAMDDACIWPAETMIIDTGVAAELPEETFGAVYARSGLSAKRGLCLANGVAVIDSDYRGTIKVPLHNLGMSRQWIRKGERIAQLVVTPYVVTTPLLVDELTDTERGSGGFGSTGR